MKLSVKGCGYLGAVHAAAMVSLGHEVVGVDPDADKIALLSAGKTPFFEPGLDELLVAGLETGKLTFTTDDALLADATVHFIGVGTPQRADGLGADMRYVDAAINDLLPYLKPGDLVVGKSTVPVGTAARLAEIIAPTGAHLVWNPEFLREGFAVKDTVEPDRLVYGTHPDTRDTDTATLDAVYHAAITAGTPRIVTDWATAELVKVAANSFLATKISFINAMAEIAETVGADVTQLADAIGHDNRIGRRFLNAGIGFGGGCLPKDIRAFTARAEELGHADAISFLKDIDQINLRRRTRVVDLATTAAGGNLHGHTIAMLGLAFKPDSDDTRDSPALDVATQLHNAGATVQAYDPQANTNAARITPELRYKTTLNDALHNADTIIIATEWPEFRTLTPQHATTHTRGTTLIDARNIHTPTTWTNAGWTYHGMGR